MQVPAILQLIASITLVFITGWYALLTHSLAKSNRESAAYARQAAEASQAAVAVAESGVDVSFRMSPFGYKPQDQPFREFGGIYIEGMGATVWIHGAELIDATKADLPDIPEFRSHPPEVLYQTGLVPNRLHRGESVSFVRGDQNEVESTSELIGAKVMYSFDGSGPITDRLVMWCRPE